MSVSAGQGFLHQFLPGNLPNFALGMSFAAAVASSITKAALVDRRRDVDAEFWSRVWMGSVGRMAFSLSTKMLGNQRRGSALTHRATELSLGMAAEQLYESLGMEARKAIGDRPASYTACRTMRSDYESVMTTWSKP
jgi:hypothetical protein